LKRIREIKLAVPTISSTNPSTDSNSSFMSTSSSGFLYCPFSIYEIQMQ
jgi:hypothetical protein